MDDSRAFLGRGFAFPPEVDPVTGRFVMAESEEDIRQSIYIILMTRKGERAMLPEFGCNLQEYIFDIPDAAFERRLIREVEDALVDFEPRIRNVSVSVDKRKLSDGVVYLNIDYYIRATNNPNNLVFPYYLEEGTGEL
ncbi:MAG: GPW/gp25 family protein [Clostridiales bacterium]|nr:GPW/gp25 family protein [Clostridiales bacterium]